MPLHDNDPADTPQPARDAPFDVPQQAGFNPVFFASNRVSYATEGPSRPAAVRIDAQAAHVVRYGSLRITITANEGVIAQGYGEESREYTLDRAEFRQVIEACYRVLNGETTTPC